MQSLSIGEAAATLGVAVSTMRRWDSENRLKPDHRTLGGHRRYALASLLRVLDPNSDLPSDRVIAYARVSSHDQKDDLERQAERLEHWCDQQGLSNVSTIKDLGSGLNYRKKGLRQLIRAIALRKISHLVVTHKDRLLRFGSELLFELCRLNGIKVSVIEDEAEVGYEQRLSADVIELMTVFSARLYGARSHKNRQRRAA